MPKQAFLGQTPKRSQYPDSTLRFILHLDCDHKEVLEPHWMETTTGITVYTWHENLYSIVASRRQ